MAHAETGQGTGKTFAQDLAFRPDSIGGSTEQREAMENWA